MFYAMAGAVATGVAEAALISERTAQIIVFCF